MVLEVEVRGRERKYQRKGDAKTAKWGGVELEREKGKGNGKLVKTEVRRPILDEILCRFVPTGHFILLLTGSCLELVEEDLFSKTVQVDFRRRKTSAATPVTTTSTTGSQGALVTWNFHKLSFWSMRVSNHG